MEKETFEKIYESCNDNKIDFTKLKEEVLNIRESIYIKLDQLEAVIKKYDLEDKE
jgi:hypothetical protein